MATYRINQLPNECRQVILALRAAKDTYVGNLALARQILKKSAIPEAKYKIMLGLIQNISENVKSR